MDGKNYGVDFQKAKTNRKFPESVCGDWNEMQEITV